MTIKSILDKLGLFNQQDDPLLTEALYRNKESLETIFRVIDKDHSGISIHYKFTILLQSNTLDC